MSAAAGAGSGGRAAGRGKRGPPRIIQSLPLITPGDLRKHYIAQFDRVINEKGQSSDDVEPTFLNKADARVEMGRQLKYPGTRREVDKWVIQDATPNNRSVPFTGQRAAGTAKYLALVSSADAEGNRVYSARLISSRYVFSKDIAYRTLTYEEMEEQSKKPKKQRRIMLSSAVPNEEDVQAAVAAAGVSRVRSRLSDGESSDGGDEDDPDARGNKGYRAAFLKGGGGKRRRDTTGLVSDEDSDEAVFGEGMADYDATRSDDSGGGSGMEQDQSEEEDDGEDVDVLFDDDEAAAGYSKTGQQMQALLKRAQLQQEEAEEKQAAAALARAQAMAAIGSGGGAAPAASAAPAPAPRPLVEARRQPKRPRDEATNAAKEELIASFIAEGGRMTVKAVVQLRKKGALSKFPRMRDRDQFKALLLEVASVERTNKAVHYVLKPAMWTLYRMKHKNKRQRR